MELSLLLAFTAVGSSFSHIVLISVLRLRCGCVKAAGGSEGLSVAQLWIQTPHVIKGHFCVISLAHASPLSPPLFFSISCPLSLLPSISRSPFFSSRKTLVSGKRWSFLPLLFQPPSPAPGHCCRPQLCVCFTAAVKDKKQPLPPPLLFSGRMSLSFPWFLCPSWISEQLPPSKVSYAVCLLPFFFFFSEGE